jgi:DNA polymerase III subunit alpha, Gram-positive type
MDLTTLLSRLQLDEPALLQGRFDGIEISLLQHQWVFRFAYDNVLPVEHVIALQQAIQQHYEKYQPVISIEYQDDTVPHDYLAAYYAKAFDRSLSEYPRLQGLSVFDKEFNGLITFFAKDDNDRELIEKHMRIVVSTARQWFVELPFRVQLHEAGVSTSEMIEEARLDTQVQAETEMEKAKQERLLATGPVEGTPLALVDIPANGEDVKEIKDIPYVISGEVFQVDKRTTQRGAVIFDVYITDHQDSILLRSYSRDADNASATVLDDILVVGKHVAAKGGIKVDKYSNDVYVEVEHIKNIPAPASHSMSDEPRVELHLHTTMSAMDAISSISDYVKHAVDRGYPAIAVTDHNGLQAFPDFAHAVKHQPIKPIYGVELNYVNDETLTITREANHQELLPATYVVFDIETTGLSVRYDHIIELSAIKIVEGAVQDEYSTFVKTKQALSAFTTQLTGITEDDLVGAPSIEAVMKEFKVFRKGAVLVAHNASFDLAHLYHIEKELGIFVAEAPSIDTLNLSRALYPELKAYNLKAMAKHLKVELAQHHRAIHDTRATAQILLKELQELYTKQIQYLDEINQLIDQDNAYKLAIPHHINLIATSRTGLTNLYKMVSIASTTHYFKEPRLLQSVLEAHHEGVLLLSSCANSDVFDAALNLDEQALLDRLKKYDVIELQPVEQYLHLRLDDPDALLHIKESMLSILHMAEELNKPVVVTSDAHYIHPNEKAFRDVYIDSPQLGGGIHPLKRVQDRPSQHFYHTSELKASFQWLQDDELIHQLVVDNPIMIADMVEEFDLFPSELFTPSDDFFATSGIPSINEQVTKMVWEEAYGQYSKQLPELVKSRVDEELSTIISRGFANVYYISHVIVKQSLDSGYLVGSRGSVGSSLVATLMNITEVNPLPPHYLCPSCGFSLFKEKEAAFDARTQHLQEHLQTVDSGYDLPSANCPRCGTVMKGEGQDIPFATFLGFEGNKVPDIDLNFSGDYQAIAHEHIRSMFGNDHAFRAGTISTIQDKTAYGYVKKYFEEKHVIKRPAEIQRYVNHIQGVKRSTGQHPGGIVVVPTSTEITQITPVQYPADDTSSTWRTTHFDYHSFENNLFKLDVLGHDDPTTIKFLMDFVKQEPADFPFSDVHDIPMNDMNVLALFNSTESLGTTKDILSKVATYGVPEFGTSFVRGMLEDTKPRTFSELLKISGLSHGTDVWLNNAKSLIDGTSSYGRIPFQDVIGCRDDIMIYLMYQGLPPAQAYDIMETARRTGKFLTVDQKNTMINHGIPDWYIWSCDQIKYMFPKAHAAAYVMMAMRIAWFKVHRAIYFYAAWFTIKADYYDIDVMLQGYDAIRLSLEELRKIKYPTAKQIGLTTSLEVALEMVARGYEFKGIDLMKSQAKAFVIDSSKKALLFPFVAIDQLGLAAAESIIEARSVAPFASLEDFKSRTKVSKPQMKTLEDMNVLDDLQPEEEAQITLF